MLTFETPTRKVWRWAVLWTLLALPAGAEAAEHKKASGDASSAPSAVESMAAWKYVAEVPLKRQGRAGGAPPLVEFVLTPPVFDGARLDLADLRLYDGRWHEVPYALRVRRPVDTTAEVAAREFNRVRDASGTSRLSLDLAQGDIEHNEVEVKTPGINFRRRAVLEGSDDGQSWYKLAERDLLRFRADSGSFVRETIAYAPCRYRYLRITVKRDPQVDDAPVEIAEVVVRRRVRVPGEIVTRPVPVGPRAAVHAGRGPGSAWIIDLGGDAVPCDRLLVDVADAEFHRDYRIEAAGPPDSDQPFHVVGAGVWKRRAGEKKAPMVARFDEVRAARLKLVVTDHRNPPLQIQAVQAGAPARVVVAPWSPELAGPLRLYFGNPKATAPNYDFGRNLPKQLDPRPLRLAVGPRRPNPGYQPEPLPLTERWPWLIYVLLGAAVAVLGALVLNLARAAIAAADARQEAAST